MGKSLKIPRLFLHYFSVKVFWKKRESNREETREKEEETENKFKGTNF